MIGPGPPPEETGGGWRDEVQAFTAGRTTSFQILHISETLTNHLLNKISPFHPANIRPSPGAGRVAEGALRSVNTALLFFFR